MGINSNEEYIADELNWKGWNLDKIPLNEIELSANKSILKKFYWSWFKMLNIQ